MRLSFTYAYSKIVGLQAGGPYQLKQDYVTLSANTQIYEIPAGREINEILWYTRAELNEAFIDPFLGAFGGSEDLELEDQVVSLKWVFKGRTI